MHIHEFLAHTWFIVAGLVLVFYVLLDGFDLGVGALSAVACDDDKRSAMMAALGPVWDGNETWLVMLGGILFGAFPVVYGVLMHALYVPVILMLVGLILRGVAFEFRALAENRAPWNLAFSLGSALAAAAQGVALGAYIDGVKVVGDSFVGGVLDWVSPFSLFVGFAVVCGYMLLGATFLIYKTTGETHERSYRRARILAVLVLACAATVSVWVPLTHPFLAARWFSYPHFLYVGLFPALALYSFYRLFRSLSRRRERSPFFWSAVIFLTSFAGLFSAMNPYILGPHITVSDAAAPTSTLVFMLVGIGVLIPVIIAYNLYNYYVFRGKVTEQDVAYH